MTSPAEGAQPPFDPPHRSSDLVLIVGQLLEATKAGADGLKGISVETRQNSLAILKAAQTLEITEKLVNELHRVIHIGNESGQSLVTMVSANNKELERLNKVVSKICDELDDGEKRMDDFDRTHSRTAGLTDAVKIGLIAVFNLITLGVALYAAFR